MSRWNSRVAAAGLSGRVNAGTWQTEGATRGSHGSISALGDDGYESIAGWTEEHSSGVLPELHTHGVRVPLARCRAETQLGCLLSTEAALMPSRGSLPGLERRSPTVTEDATSDPGERVQQERTVRQSAGAQSGGSVDERLRRLVEDECLALQRVG
ncbi:hypothetical protein OH77DRAFT_520919 [Trametes cingulata]|nr:hypothetical protein OH77DRAFT_520919 [Trametes cingulata]